VSAVVPAPRDTAPASEASTVAAPVHATRRGRLFRRYLLPILTLVTIALLASGAISVYFTYQETKSALAALQHEKALAAASRIEQYILRIERQLEYAALPQLDASNVELRRIEFLKLLRQAPEVTDVAQLDATGHERLAVSRLGMDSIGSGRDRSQEAAFRAPKAGRAWFGSVYFRKETEPYMTIAIKGGGDNGGLTLAEVNLKFIWDVVSRIHIGDKGKAYVVDDQGYLIADPDIGLVLRKTNLGALPHVRAAAMRRDDDVATLSTNLAGTRVLTSVAPIDALKWNVFVEQPVSEVYAKLNASILRTGLLLLAGLVLSALGALALARGMVRPIRTLEEGAQRIGAGDLDQKIDVRTGDELEALAAQFNRMSGQLRESYAGLEHKVAERTQELENALQQQTAISGILRVISSSPTDVQPVFDTIAASALDLCGAVSALVFTFDGALIHLAANANVDPEAESAWRAAFPRPPSRDTTVARAILTGKVSAIPDVLDDPDYAIGDMAVGTGFRSTLAVPLIRDGKPIGAIGVGRPEPGPFGDHQIAILQTFADQAVIAIENVRLFNETKEALEQQTAVAEILRVISSSPTDVRPVFDIISERALKLCDAEVSVVARLEGDLIRLGAYRGVASEGRSVMERVFPMRPDVNTITARTIRERRIVEVEDVLEDVHYDGREAATSGHFRGGLGVPMVREGNVIGSIFVARRTPGRFSQARIELLKTFADQGAIAIENVRLFNETKDALEQQTAISEILRVIPSSPSDVQPVLDTIAGAAKRLCGATAGLVFRFDGELIHLAATTNPGPADADGWRRAFPRPPSPDTATTRAVLTSSIVMIPDVLEDREYRIGTVAANTGFRSALSVPLIHDGRCIGAVGVGRATPGAFDESEISLLQTFADQAVIAIENVRLFNETKEALERQTATAEILKVISGSPTNLQPVFDCIAQRAAALSSAKYVYVTTFDGRLIQMGAAHGPGADAHRKHYPMQPSMGTLAGRVVLTQRSVAISDMLADPTYEQKESVATIGFRCGLGVPMIREGQVVGCIVAAREETGAFPDKVVELLKTFADQAVIAIENARLFNETKEALDQQTAIAQILRVISGSPTDVKPVLDAIAERAARLCDASAASMYLIEGDALRHLASKGPSPDAVTHVETLPIDRATMTGRAVLERRTIHVPDLLEVGDEYPRSREIGQRQGHRTVVVIPLLRDGNPFGAILLRRNDVRAFSDREIALLRTFGDQAAIALENVRLFNETKEALEQQRASGEVLSSISNSIADTSPVFETILASCERLFAGRIGVIDLVGDDGLVQLAAYHGPHQDRVRAIYPHAVDTSSGTGTAIATRAVVHYPNVSDVPEMARRSFEVFDIQAAIGAPMIWEGRGIGAIWVARDRSGPFSEKEIALLKTFADQAVIAIQNARLFHEIDDKSRQLEIANKHKSEFLASMSHELRTPLNAVIGFSEVLLERLFGDLNEKQEDYLKDIHSSGRHLLSLINDILDLSKIEAGRMEIEASSFDVAAAISNALTLIRERAQQHGIALSHDVEPSLGALVADERKFKQILLNLLSNAVKFTPDGGRIDVTARLVDGAAEIAVRDTGIGIAPADHAAVFEEFRQVGRDYTRKQEGTGLGLALTRKFVELHGGRIRLDSAPGCGSTFTFTIPLAS